MKKLSNLALKVKKKMEGGASLCAYFTVFALVYKDSKEITSIKYITQAIIKLLNCCRVKENCLFFPPSWE